MCPYAVWKEDNTVICEPKKEMCTFCVAGNSKTFYEIERQDNTSFTCLIDRIKNTERLYMEIRNARSI